MNLDLGQNTPTPPVIVLGEDKILHVQAKETVSDNCGNPCKQVVNISSATEILAIFQNADLTFLTLRLSTGGVVITNGPFGKCDVILSAAQTALLKQDAVGGPISGFELHVTVGGKLTIINLPQSVSIQPRMFPTS